jgi:hypothetical protein
MDHANCEAHFKEEKDCRDAAEQTDDQQDASAGFDSSSSNTQAGRQTHLGEHMHGCRCIAEFRPAVRKEYGAPGKPKENEGKRLQPIKKLHEDTHFPF